MMQLSSTERFKDTSLVSLDLTSGRLSSGKEGERLRTLLYFADLATHNLIILVGGA